MNYELAKKLKDAGFPQPGFDDRCMVYKEFNSKGEPVLIEGDYDDGIFSPTLSELIDFVGGSDILNDIENDYIQKALLKLSRNKDK